jgi:uncharacterized protein (UPF0262 family)
MTDTPDTNRLVAVKLDEASIGRAAPDVEHERAVAIYDLIADNSFALVDTARTGPYRLGLAIDGSRLIFDVRTADGAPIVAHILSLTPLKKIVRDYYIVCDSYYEAIKTAMPSRIEAIDMGRRGLHDEGSRLLQDRLSGKIVVDAGTARRLFTLICVLHWRG